MVSVTVAMGSVSVVSWGTVDVGVEAGVVSVVSHGSPGTIGLLEGVLSLDVIAVTGFRGHLDVAGVVIVDSVSELVLGVGLHIQKLIVINQSTR